jgi:hypothetical protein
MYVKVKKRETQWKIFIPMHGLKAYVRVEIGVNAHIVTALDGGGYLSSCPDTFTARKKCICTH